MIRNQKFFGGFRAGVYSFIFIALFVACSSQKQPETQGTRREVVRHFWMASIAQESACWHPRFFQRTHINSKVKEHQWSSKLQKNVSYFGVMSQRSFSSSLVLMRSVQCWTAVWCEHHLLHIGGAHPLLGLVGSVFKRHFGMPGIGLKGWKVWNIKFQRNIPKSISKVTKWPFLWLPGNAWHLQDLSDHAPIQIFERYFSLPIRF